MSSVVGRSKECVLENDYVDKEYQMWARENLAFSNEHS